jgi:hypothetical protein
MRQYTEREEQIEQWKTGDINQKWRGCCVMCSFNWLNSTLSYVVFEKQRYRVEPVVSLCLILSCHSNWANTSEWPWKGCSHLLSYNPWFRAVSCTVGTASLFVWSSGLTANIFAIAWLQIQVCSGSTKEILTFQLWVNLRFSGIIVSLWKFYLMNRYDCITMDIQYY